MYITKITNALRDALYLEAIDYDPSRISSSKHDAVEYYLRDYYRIFINQSYYFGELKFFAKCPGYKKERRLKFLKKYGSYFNHVSVPYPLYQQLLREHNGPWNIGWSMNKKYHARVIEPSYLADTGHLLFDDPKYYSIFKLKYSEYL